MVVLDTVHRDESALQADLEYRLGARVSRFDVVDTDYVRETMTVDVRYRPLPAPVAVPEERTVPVGETS